MAEFPLNQVYVLCEVLRPVAACRLIRRQNAYSFVDISHQLRAEEGLILLLYCLNAFRTEYFGHAYLVLIPHNSLHIVFHGLYHLPGSGHY